MMPQNYRPGLDVVRLAALLPVLCYHCIEAARLLCRADGAHWARYG